LLSGKIDFDTVENDQGDMTVEYNIYCDESCHLEHDNISVMVLGSVWVEAAQALQHAKRLREIKESHGISRHRELKWTKVTQKMYNLYGDVIDYFFDHSGLHFRGVLIPDKSILCHNDFRQDHHTWYYKMMFYLLEQILVPENIYNIYLDIKDTQSFQKCTKLAEVLRNSQYDFQGQMVQRIQPIRSHESEILQLADLLIGAISFANRVENGEIPGTNLGKKQLVSQIRERSGKSLSKTTWLRETKLNLLRWEPTGGEHA